SSSRWRRPANAECSSSKRESQTWSRSPKKRGTSSWPTRSQLADSKAPGSTDRSPLPSASRFARPGRDELVDQGALAGPRSQQAAHTLHVLAFAVAAGDQDRDVRV